MKILIAPDKFKDALDAITVCQAIQEGILEANPNTDTVLFPLSDGGEGLASILTFHAKGHSIKIQAHDPLNRLIEAEYGISADGKTAFIEMAQASGLQLLKPEDRNCYYTSTYGTGELILNAIQNQQVNEIILGLGGSATCDGGMGMAQALGYQFMDEQGNEQEGKGANLSKIATIDDRHLKVDLSGVTIRVACDVVNPLTGPKGAAHIFAPQKGATPQHVEALEKGMGNLAQQIKSALGKDVKDLQGAGAAGGLGAGAAAFLNGTLEKGIDLVMEQTKFETQVMESDYVITGEGKIDRQSLYGKVINGVSQLAQKYDKPVIALGGIIEVDPKLIRELGLKAAFPILSEPMNLQIALVNTYDQLKFGTFNIGQTIINSQ